MKHIKSLQWWLVLLAFLATFAVLCGGQTLAAKIKVDDPLKRSVGKITAIKEFTVSPQEDGLILKVKLNQCRNLEKVLDKARQEVEFYHKQPVREIRIISAPNHHLEEAQYQLSFYLEEAMASGRFISLKEALDACRRTQGINAKVYVEQRYLYLQLDEGNHYLYQAIYRLNEETAAIPDTMLKGGG